MYFSIALFVIFQCFYLTIAVGDNTTTTTVVNDVATLFLLGVQKGGSSSLFEFLIKHPLFCSGDHKEAHFFEHNERYERGRRYYSRMFNEKKCSDNPQAHFIDGTPQLHYMHRVASRFNEFFSEKEKKNLKFIVMLREPVSRDYSWYQHSTRAELAEGMKFSNIKTFQELDAKNQQLHNRYGRYVEQMKDLTKYFARNQVLVLNSESVFKNSTHNMEIIAKFLGVQFIEEWKQPFPHDDHLEYPRFKGIITCVLNHVPELGCPFRDELGQYYEKYNEQLYQWLRNTRQEASMYEPLFDVFGQKYKSIPCVENARKAFDEVLAKNEDKKSC